MTDLLDTLPLDWTRPEASELLDVLARAYYREAPVIEFAAAAGISPADINWSQPMAQVWHELLTKARNQNRIRALLAAASKDEAVAQRIDELIGPSPIVEAPASAGDEPVWRGFDDPAELEAQIFDEPTLLDVAFLARGFSLAPAVCRLLVTSASGRQFVGTGFRIGADLLLTNHHVLFDHRTQGMPLGVAVQAWFHFELDIEGLPRIPEKVHCAMDTVIGDARRDWAVIRTNQALPEIIPSIRLEAGVPVSVNDRVNIIQHPNGGMKKVGLHHNLVRHVDQDVLQYWTDTESGSSGSPVFDNRWRLVALHHGRAPDRADPQGRNQGTRVDHIVEGLLAAGIEFL
ncbi:trypsin-like peptidase domain-containing protein [Nocardia sp. NPDC056611]|uniref:trypsin-like peptidase domain-containing protein n=1 Tax=Nocardia sp. NPDC056611 TaxID=3345877 RepID=UPI00367057DF